MSKHITDEQKRNIVDFYKTKPMTITELSNYFNISDPTTIKILNQYRIKRYTKSQLFSPNLIESYFENIDSEFKAYFLGLIITDGCIFSKTGKQSLVTIALQDRDKYLLERFLSEIQSNKKITNTGNGCSEVSIISDKMVSDLRKYGLTERKSLIIQFPKNIDIDMMPHLIRGIFDGDGSASYYARPNRNVHVKAIRFCKGNEQFLIDLIQFLNEHVDIIPVNTFHEQSGVWSIRYAKNDSVKKIIEYMYSDATIYMYRKKKICDLIYKEVLKYSNGNTEITNLSKVG